MKVMTSNQHEKFSLVLYGESKNPITRIYTFWSMYFLHWFMLMMCTFVRWRETSMWCSPWIRHLKDWRTGHLHHLPSSTGKNVLMQQTFKDWSTIFSFSLQNKLQQVMCISCEAHMIDLCMACCILFPYEDKKKLYFYSYIWYMAIK